MDGREQALAEAFDGQAARVERGPVQTDPVALARMVEFAALPEESRVLDAGCGPGLVAEAFLAAGHRVYGVDLAGEMVRRARERCARFGAKAERVRPGGVVLVSDHVTDPDGPAAHWHREIERARDRTHERSLTSGELVDGFARAGLSGVQLLEDGFELDFDEWFDRGTPALPKEQVRARLLAGRARGFDPRERPDGGITVRCILALVRGVR